MSGKIAAACAIGVVSLLLTLLAFKLSAQFAPGIGRPGRRVAAGDRQDAAGPAADGVHRHVAADLIVGRARRREGSAELHERADAAADDPDHRADGEPGEEPAVAVRGAVPGAEPDAAEGGARRVRSPMQGGASTWPPASAWRWCCGSRRRGGTTRSGWRSRPEASSFRRNKKARRCAGLFRWLRSLRSAGDQPPRIEADRAPRGHRRIHRLEASSACARPRALRGRRRARGLAAHDARGGDRAVGTDRDLHQHLAATAGDAALPAGNSAPASRSAADPTRRGAAAAARGALLGGAAVGGGACRRLRASAAACPRRPCRRRPCRQLAVCAACCAASLLRASSCCFCLVGAGAVFSRSAWRLASSSVVSLSCSRCAAVACCAGDAAFRRGSAGCWPSAFSISAYRRWASRSRRGRCSARSR